jgi:hypothetical protein
VVKSPPAGRHLPAILCALTLLGGPGREVGAQAAVIRSEDEVKAAFLYHFTHFVEWPPAAGAGVEKGFVVAVWGSERFCAVLERTLAGKSVQERPLLVRRLSGLNDLADAPRVLFVEESDERKRAEILSRLEGSSVLTVGDSAAFAERGGIIGFRTVDNRIRFDINVDEANRSGLKISSEILKLARVVRKGKAP